MTIIAEESDVSVLILTVTPAVTVTGAIAKLGALVKSGSADVASG